MAARKPVLANVPEAGRRPVPEQVPEKRRWAFSFRFWRQLDNFGLGDCEARWFVSFLERLGEMSGSTVSDVMDDLTVREALRVHDINWVSNNIPIEANDIDWVDEVYWNNRAEFPLMQFHVSKALGRVAGFLDENRVFNIVLVDPMHNLQPSAYNNYKIQATTYGECELTTMVSRVESVVGAHAELSMEGRKRILQSLRGKPKRDGRTLLLMPVDGQVIDTIDAFISLGTHTDPGAYLVSVIEEAFGKL